MCKTIGYYSAIKKGNPFICDNMDEVGGHNANSNKPDIERQKLKYCIVSFICGLLKKR